MIATWHCVVGVLKSRADDTAFIVAGATFPGREHIRRTGVACRHALGSVPIVGLALHVTSGQRIASDVFNSGRHPDFGTHSGNMGNAVTGLSTRVRARRQWCMCKTWHAQTFCVREPIIRSGCECDARRSRTICMKFVWVRKNSRCGEAASIVAAKDLPHACGVTQGCGSSEGSDEDPAVGRDLAAWRPKRSSHRVPLLTSTP